MTKEVNKGKMIHLGHIPQAPPVQIQNHEINFPETFDKEIQFLYVTVKQNASTYRNLSSNHKNFFTKNSWIQDNLGNTEKSEYLLYLNSLQIAKNS